MSSINACKTSLSYTIFVPSTRTRLHSMPKIWFKDARIGLQTGAPVQWLEVLLEVVTVRPIFSHWICCFLDLHGPSPMAVQWRSGANSPGIWSCIFGPEEYLKVCIPGCECQAGQRVCFSFCVFARHLQKWRLLRFCKFIGFLASVTLLNSIHAKGPDVCPVLWLDVN